MLQISNPHVRSWCDGINPQLVTLNIDSKGLKRHFDDFGGICTVEKIYDTEKDLFFIESQFPVYG